MAFVDMPKPVEKVMHRLFAPKFDVSLEEIEDTLNIFNHIQDEIRKDERGKLLQSLMTMISGEAVEDDFKQAILKHHPSVPLKPDLAESIVNLIKEIKENKEHPLLCQPLNPDNRQFIIPLRNENKSIFLPNYLDNSINFSDVEDSNVMEHVVMTSFPGATKSKDGQGCKKHAPFIPGCAKFPLSRMMYEQEGTDVTDNSSQHEGNVGAGWCPETTHIAEELNACRQLFKKEGCSWNSTENISMMTNQFVETAPMGSTVSVDKYYCIPRDERVSSFNISKKDKRESSSHQEGASSRTAKYHTNNEVLLQRVGTNCIMVAVKDKTNKFILPKPENCTRMDKNDMELVTNPSKGISAKGRPRKRHGIDVMALCGGYKVGKVSTGNCGFPRGKASRVNTRKACQAGNSGLKCFKGVGKSTSVGHFKESGQRPWENVPERFPTPLQNDSQQAKKGNRGTEWVELYGKKRCEVVSSPCSGGLGQDSLQEIALKEKEKLRRLMTVSNEGALMQLLYTDDLKAGGVVGKDQITTAEGEDNIIEDEEEEDVLIIDEDPPLVVDPDDSTMDEEKSHGTTDAKIIGNTSYWNGRCWIPAVHNQGDCCGQPKEEVSHCEQANSSRKMYFNTTSSYAEVGFKETDSQSNTSDASSLDASSSADSLSVSQDSVGGSLRESEMPEHSFLFNLLKCHNETEDEDSIKFSWKKVMPKKKAKLRRSRRTRRAKVAYEN